MDRLSWHDDYGRPGSSLARRLHAVQVQIRAVLDSAPPGPLKVIGLCAGQGRDLLEVRWLSGPGEGFGVGVHRFAGSPQPLVEGLRMFTFVGSGPPRSRRSPRLGMSAGLT